MNNSSVRFVEAPVPEKPDREAILVEREAKLVRVIEALQQIQRSKEWSSLKTELFDSLAENLKVRLLAEARSLSPDVAKLSHLAGQLEWAEKYSDLSKLEKMSRTELTNIKNMLHGQKPQG